MLADNSKTPYTMIAEGGDDNIKIYDKRKYDKILKMNEEYVIEKEGRRNENEDGH